MERILGHWHDLDSREPTLKIVCRDDYSRRGFRLFPNGCPNLLWELMRTRRAQLSASQLMRKNPTEAIGSESFKKRFRMGIRLAQLDEQERRESEPISYVSRLPRWSD